MGCAMRHCVLALTVCVAALSVQCLAQSPYEVVETLPIQTPGKKTIILNYTNENKFPVIFQSHSLSCGCTSLEPFKKLNFAPGESTNIALVVDVRSTPSELQDITLTIDGVIKSDADGNNEERRLAAYHLVIPTTKNNVRLLRPNDPYFVTNGKCSPVVILNATTFVWGDVRVTCSRSELAPHATLATASLNNLDVQVVQISFEKLDVLTGNAGSEPDVPIVLNVFAKAKNTSLMFKLAMYQ